MNEVHAKRQSVVITKRGKPVAKLVPVEKKRDDIFGFLKGKIKVTGDVVAPAFTPEEWGDLYRSCSTRTWSSGWHLATHGFRVRHKGRSKKPARAFEDWLSLTSRCSS